MSEPIKLPPPAVEDYDMELWGQNVRVDLYTAKQVLTAVEQSTAELRAECEALRADAERYAYVLANARRIDICRVSLGGTNMDQLSARIDAAREEK